MVTTQAPSPHRTLAVVPTSPEQHTAFLEARHAQGGAGTVSFLQSRSWGLVKPDWTSEHLGWFDDTGQQVGAALVLYRPVPGGLRLFAYIPEGPVLDWAAPDLDNWLAPMLDHVRNAGAFAVRMGPPLSYRRWSAATLKAAVGPGRRIGDVLPDAVDPLGTSVAERLRESGWLRCDSDAQPRHVFEVPLAKRSADDVWTGFNQEWRRNIKKAAKCGVTAEIATADYLPTFHELLLQTERRDGFRLGRSLEYFQRQHQVLNEEQPSRMRLYVARHQGEVLAAHTMISFAGRVWYQTGASADHRREVRPSHALQWRMMCDAIAQGTRTYDMRGVPDTLDPGQRPFGLMRWKLGTGGEIAESLGEWDLPLYGAVNRTLHRAMRAYLSRR
ncbi:peptidoglycan bridge formation glycyltransferase FemA/FemB family protein [Streptomyces longwoodensis]|uniref:lipid II:glycine glycyltransferase FemX n=1 Tax=Streptomyces longwoodensis TaxID=68231 RepID=UPI0036E2699E